PVVLARQLRHASLDPSRGGRRRPVVRLWVRAAPARAARAASTGWLAGDRRGGDERLYRHNGRRHLLHALRAGRKSVTTRAAAPAAARTRAVRVRLPRRRLRAGERQIATAFGASGVVTLAAAIVWTWCSAPRHRPAMVPWVTLALYAVLAGA